MLLSVCAQASIAGAIVSSCSWDYPTLFQTLNYLEELDHFFIPWQDLQYAYGDFTLHGSFAQEKN